MAEAENERVSDILKTAVTKNLINDVTPSIDAYDMDYLSNRLNSLKSAFPEDFVLNTVVLKCNSIRGILALAATNGFGAECASLPEVMHALSLNFPASKVVYYCPVKTRHELQETLKAGVVINLDNEHEMELVEELLATSCSGSNLPSIGLRINPVLGAAGSTAIKESKFGLPVTAETRSKIINLYKKYNWLNGIHFHVGSFNVALEAYTDAARFCINLVQEVESTCGRNLKTIDIGGGISTSYDSPSEPDWCTYAKYRTVLEESVPEMFTGKYRLITEFGRSLILKAGLTFSRIEYVKAWIPDMKPIIMINVGANQFVREGGAPELWRHRHSVASKSGTIKTGDKTKVYDIAGPMCFQRDILTANVSLPHVEPGDILVVHDIGAYTFSVYSKWHSILPSPVYGFSKKDEDGSYDVMCLKERETVEETLQFWGSVDPRII